MNPEQIANQNNSRYIPTPFGAIFKYHNPNY